MDRVDWWIDNFNYNLFGMKLTSFDTNESVRTILLRLGFVVTQKKQGGWNNGKRMITDLLGNEVGFLSPLDALKYARSKR